MKPILFLLCSTTFLFSQINYDFTKVFKLSHNVEQQVVGVRVGKPLIDGVLRDLPSKTLHNTSYVFKEARDFSLASLDASNDEIDVGFKYQEKQRGTKLAVALNIWKYNITCSGTLPLKATLDKENGSFTLSPNGSSPSIGDCDGGGLGYVLGQIFITPIGFQPLVGGPILKNIAQAIADKQNFDHLAFSKSMDDALTEIEWLKRIGVLKAEAVDVDNYGVWTYYRYELSDEAKVLIALSKLENITEILSDIASLEDLLNSYAIIEIGRELTDQELNQYGKMIQQGVASIEDIRTILAESDEHFEFINTITLPALVFPTL